METASADLIQRHTLVSHQPSQTNKKIFSKRPPLSILKRSDALSPLISSRDFLFTLSNQNARLSLLYGKNNVILGGSEGNNRSNKGYLSLHQDTNRSLFLKWTPNSLLASPSSNSGNSSSVFSSDVNSSSSPSSNNSSSSTSTSIRIESVDQIHVHSTKESAEVVLVDCEGVPGFTFKFVEKIHCLCFLRSLAKALEPSFQFDPPLWSTSTSNGRTPSPRFGLLNKWRWSASSSSMDSSKSFSESVDTRDLATEAEFCGDRVFRIQRNSNLNAVNSLDRKISRSNDEKRCSTDSSSNRRRTSDILKEQPFRDSLEDACKTMQKQLLARAFHGWLTYCRSLAAIRTQLLGIVTGTIFSEQSREFSTAVDEEFWKECRAEPTEQSRRKFLLRVFFNGVNPDLRTIIWPYLLRLVDWGEKFDERLLTEIKQAYEQEILEWSLVEEKMNAIRDIKVKTPTNKDTPAVELQNGAGDFPIVNQRKSSDVDSVGKSTYSDVFEPEVVSPADAPCSNEDGNSGTPEDEVVLQEELVNDDQKDTIIQSLEDELDINLNRIDKDVQRCDRNTEFYSHDENLKKLRRVMCTYIYRQLKVDIEDGYVQGMCDLVAPLLVVLRDEDESLVLACFEKLMERMRGNFPQSRHNGYIEKNLQNLRVLVEVMDPELFTQMMNDVDYTFVVFYRWLLLDFKRELTYNEVFKLWEIMWAADHLETNFQLFFGLALLVHYREVIIENKMDFTDVIKFFNEMAEQHNVDELLNISRDKVFQFQKIVSEMNSPAQE